MKKLILIALAVVLVLVVVNFVLPHAGPDLLKEDLEKLTNFWTENIINGKFLMIVPKGEVEKAVEQMKDAGVSLTELDAIRGYLEEKGLTQEEFFDQLSVKKNLKNLRFEVLTYIEKQYCAEHGIAYEDAPKAELLTYERQVLMDTVREVLRQMKAARN